MPEGHSIFRLARQFESVFVGEALAVSSPQGRFSAGARLLDRRVLLGARAHGKHLFLDFGGPVLHVHLGLYGAFSFGGDSQFSGASSIGAPRRIGERESAGERETGVDGQVAPYTGPPEPVGAVRVRLVSAHGWADLRGATTCEVLTAPEIDSILARLGPDPINPSLEASTTDPDADFQRFAAGVVRRKAPIGQLLMAQEVIAGVGNIYRAESLFAVGLDPRTPAHAVPGWRVRALWDVLVLWMRRGSEQGRIITTTPLTNVGSGGDLGVALGDLGVAVGGVGVSLGDLPESEAHWVYQRAGLPCRLCRTPIVLGELAARKVYWCPSCQATP